jgi:copper(I)-binding protein
MEIEDNVMRMREIQGGLEIKPGQKVELNPDSVYHLMFMDLREPLKQGDTRRGQLGFEKAV